MKDVRKWKRRRTIIRDCILSDNQILWIRKRYRINMHLPTEILIFSSIPEEVCILGYVTPMNIDDSRQKKREKDLPDIVAILVIS